MARLFDDASNQYLATPNVIVSSAPMTMVSLFNVDVSSGGVINCVISEGSRFDNDERYAIRLYNGNVQWNVRASAVESSAVSTTTYSINRWHHACGIEYTNNDRAVFLDGSGKGTNNDTRSPSSLYRTRIGLNPGSGIQWGMSGLLAETAIYNAALTDAEVKLLAMGLSPLLVRRQNLVFYAPLTYRSQDFDIVGRLNMTAYNSPSWAEHPVGITYPEPAPPMIKEQLPYFWTLPVVTEEEALSVQLNTLSAVLSAQGITMSPGEVAVMLNELSLTSSIEDIIVSLAGGTTFPFSDDWTGADFAEWNATKWTTVAG